MIFYIINFNILNKLSNLLELLPQNNAIRHYKIIENLK